MGFYDELASQYAELTGEASRREPARRFVDAVIERFDPSSVLDVACGTGLYAVEFARRGLEVVGADPSEGMLDQARRRAGQADVEIDFHDVPMQQVAARLDRRFDLVICLGNSIPHVLTDDDLDDTLSGFARLLNPGGVVLIQLLNYQKVLQRGERIVGIDRGDNVEYVRFYDFADDLLHFNVLEIHWHRDLARHTLHQTTLRPWTADHLEQQLRKHNLTDVTTFAGLSFEPMTDDADTVTVCATAV